MRKTLYSTSSAAFMTGVPQATIISMERRGAVGPYQRDSNGRRLLTDEDIDQLRAYAEDRRRRKAA
jgi:DNA-binding transcriptional MerR regulator